MGFLDSFKRWRLARQGLSSGRKRRIHSENPVVAALEVSQWVKLTLYGFFSLLIGALVLNASDGSLYGENQPRGALFAAMAAATAMLMYHLCFGPGSGCHRNSRVMLVLSACMGHILLVRLMMSLADTGAIPELLRFLLIPYALAPMLLTILLGRGVGALATVTVSLAGAFFVPRDMVFSYIMVGMISGMAATLFSHAVRKRVQLLRSGIYVGTITILLAILSNLLDVQALFADGNVSGFQLLGTGASAMLGTAVFTALTISGLLPVFEGMFKLTTDISWLELSDLNHRLLRRMQIEAPGTFHHSVVVASLAEAAAEKIGANAAMCRVCAYFHDVGKLNKPGYFIENQSDEADNPHDSLTPTMSALIIIAHVKDGVDLAVKHKLNPRVIDVIQEHHGDSLVSYFYHKAREQKKIEMEKIDRKIENPEDLPVIAEKNFRYPGPRPRTRESGIIALADTIESASRTLRKPTPGKIQSLVEDLVRAKLQDGQLDECPLTLEELAAAKKSFCDTLRSMLHNRIDYPQDNREKDESRVSRKTPTRRSQPAIPGGDVRRMGRPEVAPE